MEFLFSYIVPVAPETYEIPFANARYLIGSTSLGIDCAMAIVDRANPFKIPPPMSIGIDDALAEVMAPAAAIKGGMAARYFLSRTSLSRPMMGDRTHCMRRGPSRYQQISKSLLT